VQLANNGAVSAPFAMQLQSYAPGFFEFNGGPYAAATHSNGSLAGPASLFPGASTPVTPGEILTLYADGLGQTSPPLTSGSVTQTGTLPALPQIKIGGLAAAVQFAGVVSPGLYQLNVYVPASAPAGDNTVVATYNGTSSNTALISVSATMQNPMPTITSLSPASGTAGANSLVITINGTGFLAASAVTFNGNARTATFLNAAQLTISLNSSDLSKSGTFPVVVTNPAPGGGSSQPVLFTVQPAAATPTLQALAVSPTMVVGGGSVTGTITLTAAAPTSGVQVQVSSSSSSVKVPAVVTVAGGQGSATFTITTTSVTTTQNITVSATLGGTTRTAVLSVTPATASTTYIYAGTDSGIFRSSDDGVTWQLSLTSNAWVSAIAVDPSNHANVYASGVDYSIPAYLFYRSTDAGATWATATVSGGIGYSLLAIDAASSGVIYRGYEASSMYRSTDGGSTWSATPFAQVFGVTADPSVSGVVYASAIASNFGDYLLYKSSDFGATWVVLATDLNLPTNNFARQTSITIDPHNSSTLYASGTGSCTPGNSSSVCGLFKSTDGGNSWNNLGVQGTYSYSNIAINYTTGGLFAGGALPPNVGFVVKSSDGGTTWTPINSGLTTASAVVLTDPSNTSNLFAVGQSSAQQLYDGVFRSTNGGATWTYTQIEPYIQDFSLGVPRR
jgi:hypothetical protein